MHNCPRCGTRYAAAAEFCSDRCRKAANRERLALRARRDAMIAALVRQRDAQLYASALAEVEQELRAAS